MKNCFVFLFVLLVNDIKTLFIGLFKNYFKEGYMLLIIILYNFFGIFWESGRSVLIARQLKICFE